MSDKAPTNICQRPNCGRPLDNHCMMHGSMILCPPAQGYVSCAEGHVGVKRVGEK